MAVLHSSPPLPNAPSAPSVLCADRHQQKGDLAAAANRLCNWFDFTDSVEPVPVICGFDLWHVSVSLFGLQMEK